jgi:hypothetical protein
MSAAGRRHPNVVNVSELEPQTASKGTRFGFSARKFRQGTGVDYYDGEKID